MLRGEILGYVVATGRGLTTFKPPMGLVLGPTGARRPESRLLRAAETRPSSRTTAAEYLDYAGRLFGLARDVRRRRARAVVASGPRAIGGRADAAFLEGDAEPSWVLAQALVNDPELLFLDEPTSGLDPAGASRSTSFSTSAGAARPCRFDPHPDAETPAT